MKGDTMVLKKQIIVLLILAALGFQSCFKESVIVKVSEGSSSSEIGSVSSSSLVGAPDSLSSITGSSVALSSSNDTVFSSQEPSFIRN